MCQTCLTYSMYSWKNSALTGCNLWISYTSWFDLMFLRISLLSNNCKKTKNCQIINNVQILDLVWRMLNYYDLSSTANDLHFFLTIFFVYLNFNQFVVSDHLNHSTSFFQKDFFPSWMNKTRQKSNCFHNFYHTNVIISYSPKVI